MSAERVAHELLRLLGETEAGRAVDRLGDLGVDVALHPELHAEGELVAAAELGALETGADRVLAGLAALAVRSPARLGDWIGTLGLDAGRREAAARAARTAPLLAGELRPAHAALGAPRAPSP